MSDRFLRRLAILALSLAAAPAVAQQPGYDVTPAPGYDAGGVAAQPPGYAPPSAAGTADAAPGAIAPIGPPRPPLSDVELQFIQQTLQMWEGESAKISTFNAEFQRLEYDMVFGPGESKPLLVRQGTLSYSKPDKGSFKIDKTTRWTATDPQNPAAGGTYTEQDEIGEHWVCDGKAVFEYNHRQKQLVVTPIPEGMRGRAIADGPLPFLFGAEAQKLMQRYDIRPLQGNPEQIWLKAYPRYANDAANYESVEVILDRKTMHPVALKVYLPGRQQQHVYTFDAPTINGKLDAWFGGLFSAPRTPFGWTRVVVDDTPAPGPQAAMPGDGVQR